MKIPLGSVIEIRVDSWLAYALYTHEHPHYSELIRIFSGLREKRPEDIEEVVRGEVEFSCFTLLKKFIKNGYGEIVGIARTPERLQDFPVFRAGMKNAATGKVDPWWLWDGEKEWRIGQLQPSQLALPIRGIYGAELILQYVREGWRPETADW